MRFFKLFSVLLFSLMLGTMLSMAAPVNPYTTALVISIITMCIPKQKNVLAMNGIEAREDFTNVVNIFDRAFNPRFVFNQATNLWVDNPNYSAIWDAVSAFRLTQQTLTLEQPMVAGSNVYKFPIQNNQQNQVQQFNTEIRLAQNDTFVPTHVGFFVEYPTSGIDATFVPRTYPNLIQSAQPVQETAFYNGTLSIMVQNVQYTANWDLWRHYKVNQTQQTAALGAGSPEDQFDGSIDGWYPMQPFVLMIGSQNIQINVNLPVAPAAVTAFGRLRLQFRGVLAQQSTVVN